MPNGLGFAIGLQPKATFETAEILKSMRLADQQIQEEMARKRAERKKLKEDEDKYAQDLNNFILKEDTQMLPIRHKEFATYAQKVMDEASKIIDEGGNPYASQKVLDARLKLKSYALDAKTEYKTYTTDIANYQKLHPEERTDNPEVLEIPMQYDTQKWIDWKKGQAQKARTERLADPYGWYQRGDLYQVKNKPTDVL